MLVRLKIYRVATVLALGLGAVLALSSTAWAAASDPPLLRVGFAPFENATDVMKKTAPVTEALHRELKMPVKAFVAADYPGVVEAMKSGKLDVAFFSPAAFVMAERVAKARVILKWGYKGRMHYYSAIITRADTGIKAVRDLKGKNFAFVDPASTTGSVYPKLMMLQAGLNPERDLGKVIYAGGHDAAILAVANGKVDAAGTFANDDRGDDVPWKKILKGDAGKIRALQYSKPIPNGAIAVGPKVTPSLERRIKQAFLHMGSTPEGKKFLSQMYLMETFAPATSAEYETVREAFVKVGLPVK